MKERIAIAIIEWLLRFAPDWMLCAASTYEKLRYLAAQTEAVERRAHAIDMKADNVLRLVEPLNAENDRLRAQVEQQEAAYAALMEEMEELLHG